MRAGELIENQ